MIVRRRDESRPARTSEHRVCDACQTPALDEDQFCGRCGRRLPTKRDAPPKAAPTSQACASCGAPAQPDDRYCGACGATLTASTQRSRPRRPRRGASRRLAPAAKRTPVGPAGDDERAHSVAPEMPEPPSRSTTALSLAGVVVVLVGLVAARGCGQLLGDWLF
ncbi:MAG: zinc ribbon domain-containing protein [Acidobacteria bacterium]|nr:zinc ribbon domain-containing protein [Acidobacteriota bacterium]